MELYARVFGFVQGVGFRATARHHAMRHNLKGYARNMSDGSVELVLQGEEKEIEEFFNDLENAFDAKYIRRIERKLRAPERQYSSFACL